jgi:hypothetical protein
MTIKTKKNDLVKDLIQGGWILIHLWILLNLGQAWTKILCSNSLHQSVISFIWVEPTIEMEIILSDLLVVLW